MVVAAREMCDFVRQRNTLLLTVKLVRELWRQTDLATREKNGAVTTGRYRDQRNRADPRGSAQVGHSREQFRVGDSCATPQTRAKGAVSQCEANEQQGSNRGPHRNDQTAPLSHI
jgi:hypothetical protein